jgi:hypothetical protein
VGLIARGLELKGIATTLTSWKAGIIRYVKPPRVTISSLDRGATLGKPLDNNQQLRVLKATLDLLKKDAPLEPVLLDEKPE